MNRRSTFNRSRNKNNKRRFSGNKFNNKPSINVEDFIKKIESTPKKTYAEVTSTFADFKLVKQLSENISQKSFVTPTTIQDKAIPLILEGKDIHVLANTGTGKTATYLIPLINKLSTNKDEKVLIVAPTRELASQIDAEFRSLTKNIKVYSVLLTGGTSLYKQTNSLRRPYNFIIATPGRLKDLINRKNINISNVKTLVLDEVDRMLDMGFIVDMRFFMKLLPENRQSLFFSATSTKSIENLIISSSKDLVKIDVTVGITSDNISQSIVKYPTDHTKVDVLHDTLIKIKYTKVLIFGRTKRGVDRLSKDLKERGFKVDEIHGDKRQNARARALALFKTGKVDILIATDVASRGIDIDDVSHVINYDLPDTFEDYIHRVGRTGRANKQGEAISLVSGS